MDGRWPPGEWIKEDKSYIKDIEKWAGFLMSIEYEYRYSLKKEHKSMCNMIKEDVDQLLKEKIELEGMIRSYEQRSDEKS